MMPGEQVFWRYPESALSYARRDSNPRNRLRRFTVELTRQLKTEYREVQIGGLQ